MFARTVVILNARTAVTISPSCSGLCKESSQVRIGVAARRSETVASVKVRN